MRISLLVFVLVCPAAAHAGWFGPSNYQDCILENMKGVTDRTAAIAIEYACATKFPDTAPSVWRERVEEDQQQRNLPKATDLFPDEKPTGPPSDPKQ